MNSRERMVEAYMAQRLSSLSRAPNGSRVRAQLAGLRRGIGKKPGDMPELWGMLFADMPEEMMSRNGAPTREKWAVHTALSLYAQHQQGRNLHEKNMHCEQDVGRLDRAVGLLVSDEDDRQRVARRFNAFATASDMQEAEYPLRGLVQILCGEDILLDYVRLAGELYRFRNLNDAPLLARIAPGSRWQFRLHANPTYSSGGNGKVHACTLVQKPESARPGAPESKNTDGMADAPGPGAGLLRPGG